MTVCENSVLKNGLNSFWNCVFTLLETWNCAVSSSKLTILYKQTTRQLLKSLFPVNADEVDNGIELSRTFRERHELVWSRITRSTVQKWMLIIEDVRFSIMIVVKVWCVHGSLILRLFFTCWKPAFHLSNMFEVIYIIYYWIYNVGRSDVLVTFKGFNMINFGCWHVNGECSVDQHFVQSLPMY